MNFKVQAKVRATSIHLVSSSKNEPLSNFIKNVCTNTLSLNESKTINRKMFIITKKINKVIALQLFKIFHRKKRSRAHTNTTKEVKYSYESHQA